MKLKYKRCLSLAIFSLVLFPSLTHLGVFVFVFYILTFNSLWRTYFNVSGKPSLATNFFNFFCILRICTSLLSYPSIPACSIFSITVLSILSIVLKNFPNIFAMVPQHLCCASMIVFISLNYFGGFCMAFNFLLKCECDVLGKMNCKQQPLGGGGEGWEGKPCIVLRWGGLPTSLCRWTVDFTRAFWFTVSQVK